MAESDNRMKAEKAFDPLNMDNYKIEKLPKMQKSGFEIWMARLGAPLALIAFVWICWFCHIGFIDHLDQSLLAASAQKRLAALGLDGFIRANYAMLAIFVASLILWMTEALPNYLTSLLLILLTVLLGVTTQKEALAQLGHPVMWLNILSFVLASMLVKTQFAKRLALAFVIKFGKSAKGVLWSFLLINLVLSAFISATTVKATIMLPIFMVICAIYGASDGHRNNFGRNLVIQNLFQVNIGANAFYTGSGAHLLAISLIAGFLGSCDFGYKEWLVAVGPMSLIILVVGLLVGMYIFFPMKKEEQVPRIEGGIDRLKAELAAMGKMSKEEWRAVAIFLIVLLVLRKFNIVVCSDVLHCVNDSLKSICEVFLLDGHFLFAIGTTINGNCAIVSCASIVIFLGLKGKNNTLVGLKELSALGNKLECAVLLVEILALIVLLLRNV